MQYRARIVAEIGIEIEDDDIEIAMADSGQTRDEAMDAIVRQAMREAASSIDGTLESADIEFIEE